VVRRANRLSLRGWIEAHNTNSVTVTAEGPEALVDALEIACSLGPIDSDVESWTRSDKPIGVNAAAFERRVESVVGKD
ncbi:MAG TPA: acylphosphatase, partial [Nitrospiraceae bacterium]|nr:acylphosphatase [Nitrospiraceae bacterium]